MVQWRGNRLEVDNPTKRQLRNKRWLAQHPHITTPIGAAVMAALGLLVADLVGFTWVVGAMGGAAYGALLGWGFSVEHHESPARGLTKLLYWSTALISIAGLIAFKAAT